MYSLYLWFYCLLFLLKEKCNFDNIWLDLWMRRKCWMLWYPLKDESNAFSNQVCSTAQALSCLGIKRGQYTFRTTISIIQWEMLLERHLVFYMLITKFTTLPCHSFCPFLSENVKGVICFFLFPTSLKWNNETEKKFEKDGSHYNFSLVSCFTKLRQWLKILSDIKIFSFVLKKLTFTGQHNERTKARKRGGKKGEKLFWNWKVWDRKSNKINFPFA